MMKLSLSRLMVLFMLVGAACTAANAADIKLGVNAPRGALEAKKWEPLGKYIAAGIGKSVEIMPLPPAQLDDAVAQGRLDFALVNPVTAVIVSEMNKAKLLATMKADGTPNFAGVIFSKKGGKVNSLSDLKGKNVMAYQFGVSAGAYVFQAYYVSQHGIDVQKDFASFKEAKKQDDIVLGVQSGVIDAGFVRTGVLESMAKDGKIKMDEFVIIDSKKDDVNFVHSTPPYPEWFMVATATTDANLAAKLKEVILNLKSSDEAATTAKIEGFVEALSLDSLKAALKSLKLAPYDG